MSQPLDRLVAENLDIWTSATQRKSGAGRGGGKRISLYGIERLRALILDLAVRGKLVPQYAVDEPAGELLARSAKAMNASVQLDRFRAPAKTLPRKDSEAVPDNWVAARLGALVRVINGRAYKKPELLTAGTPVLRVGNLFTSNHWYYSDLDLEDDKYIDDGDLIYAWSASFGPFIWSGGRVIYHYHIWKLEPYSEADVSRDFLRLFLANETAAIKASGHGIAMLHMTKERMEQLPLPLPPLAEQRRIVAKVDELMALCDALERESAGAMAAHTHLVEELLATLVNSASTTGLAANWARLEANFDTLFTTDASIEALKQTILDLAVRGKLLEQDTKDEAASALLTSIVRQKKASVASGAIRSSKNLDTIAPAETPFAIPSNWSWVRLGTACLKITDGTHHSPENLPTGDFKYISAKNIKPWGIDQSEMTYVSAQDHQEIYSRCNPELGDILYIKDGATTGIGTINSIDEPFSMLSSVALLKPSAGLFNEYLLKCMTAPAFYVQMRSEMTGVAITRVTLKKLENALIPLPPLAEQHRIVAKVDALMALCDALKSRLADAAQTQRHLADAITERAAA